MKTDMAAQEEAFVGRFLLEDFIWAKGQRSRSRLFTMENGYCVRVHVAENVAPLIEAGYFRHLPVEGQRRFFWYDAFTIRMDGTLAPYSHEHDGCIVSFASILSAIETLRKRPGSTNTGVSLLEDPADLSLGVLPVSFERTVLPVLEEAATRSVSAPKTATGRPAAPAPGGASV